MPGGGKSIFTVIIHQIYVGINYKETLTAYLGAEFQIF